SSGLAPGSLASLSPIVVRTGTNMSPSCRGSAAGQAPSCPATLTRGIQPGRSACSASWRISRRKLHPEGRSMFSPCRNPERRAAARRLLPFALVTVFAVAANNASAQQDTAPDAQHGPNQVAVTGLFPNGGAPPPQDPIGTRFE